MISADPTEQMEGEVVGGRDPARGLLEEDARHRLEHGPDGGEPVARHLGHGDEVVGLDARRGEGGGDGGGVGGELLGEDGLHLGQVDDAARLETHDHGVGGGHEDGAGRAHDRRPAGPHQTHLEVDAGPEGGVERRRVPHDAPVLVPADQDETAVVLEVADPADLEVGGEGGLLLVDQDRPEGGLGDPQVVPHGGDGLGESGRGAVDHRRHGGRVEPLPGLQIRS